jgi:hypothetical protein
MAASLTASGLAMPASASLQGDVNTLDDYQEGTGTSAFLHSGSSYGYTDQQLHYVKIGKNVMFSVYLALNSGSSFAGGSGGFQVSGWPFTVLNLTNYFGYTHIGYSYKIGWHKTTSGDVDNSSSSPLNFANVRAESNETKGSCICCTAALAYALDGNDCITHLARLQYGGWYITAS